MVEIDKGGASFHRALLGWTAVDQCQVQSGDKTASSITGLGGQPDVPRTDVPHIGRFATVGDPQGVEFALFTPAEAGAQALTG
jgi:hypothetical protein